MSSLHTARRRTSSEQQSDDLDETTSLLLSRTLSQEYDVVESNVIQTVMPSDNAEVPESIPWPYSVRFIIFLCAYLTSLSFGVTQVPLLYVFRLMTCDAYYKDHSSLTPAVIAHSQPARTIRSKLLSAVTTIAYSTRPKSQSGSDRCSLHEIESSTALSVSLMGASTTICGLANLFLTGYLIKRIGVKPTLIIQVFFPAVRLLVQNVGVEFWGKTGIIIVQCSQMVSILGGPSGYMLALNTFITEVVEYEGRTAALGRLNGSMLFGTASGFLLGGVVAEAFGIKAPFRLTFVLFLSACTFVAIFLPNIPPPTKFKIAKVSTTGSVGAERKKKDFKKILGPLAVFAPQRFMSRDGAIQTEYGTLLLAWGVFLGILATGYLQTLLQLYSTDVFGFGTIENGWLIFMYSMLRGVFLTFAFPRIITIGRRITSEHQKDARHDTNRDGPESSEREPLLITQTDTATATESETNKNKGPKEEQTFTFDLTYARFSLVADGLLTLLCSFVREGWQMYLVATVLPFAAGTGSAAKGVILQMVGKSASSSERTDALVGISLVENIARLSTTFVFGVLFAAFASIGRAELLFTCNAAVALLGFVVLLFARFPPEGSHPLDKEDIPGPTS